MTDTLAGLTPLQHATRAAYTRADSTIPFERRSPRRRAYWEDVTTRAVTTAVERAGLAELFAYLHHVRLLEDGWWTCGCGEQLTQEDEEVHEVEHAHFDQVVRDAVLGDGVTAWSGPVPTCPRCESADVVVHQLASDAGVTPAGIDCRACGGTGMISREDQDKARVVSDLVYAIVDSGVIQSPADDPVVMRLAGSPIDAAQVAQWLRAAHEAGREAGRQECQDEHTD
jgi:hypothetical protein